ncbi:MAG: hypothetical protein HY717_03365 [Planctomycetes bacterium]|nr:hypothetical protein [Planctomycetota bacterium]
MLWRAGACWKDSQLRLRELLTFLILGLSAFTPRPFFAQEDHPPLKRRDDSGPPPPLEVSGWFHRGIQEGMSAAVAGWLPVYLELANHQKEAMRVQVEGALLSKEPQARAEPEFQTQAAVEVPAGSKKRLWIYLRYHASSSNDLSLQTAVVRVRAAGTEQYHKRWQFYCGREDAELSPLGLVSGEHLHNGGSPWGDSMQGDSRQSQVSGRKLEAIEERWLPDDPLGYQSMDLLILRNFDEREMDGKQLEAIRDWVFLGGWTILVPSPGGEIFSTRLAKLLLPPDSFREMKTEEKFEPAGLATMTGNVLRQELRKWWEGERPRLSYLRLDPADLPANAAGLEIFSLDKFQAGSARSSGRRLYLELPFGRGKVGVLTIDDQSISGETSLEFRRALWWEILQPAGHHIRQRQARWSSQVGEFQNERLVRFLKSGLSPELGLWFLAILVLIYLLIIGPGLYFFLKRINRLPWVVWLEPAIVVMYVGLIFLTGHLTRGVLNQMRAVSILHWREGAPFAEKEAYLGVFSSNDARFQIRAPGSRWLRPVFSNDQEAVGVQMTASSKDSQRPRTIAGFHLDLWQTGVFAAMDLVPMKGALEIARSGDPTAGVTKALQISNGTPFSILRGLAFDTVGACYQVGGIPPGGRAVLEGEALRPVDLRQGSSRPRQQAGVQEEGAFADDPLLAEVVLAIIRGEASLNAYGNIACIAVLDRRDADFEVEPGASLKHRADLLVVYR